MTGKVRLIAAHAHIHPDIHARVVEYAAAQGLSFSAAAARLVERGLASVQGKGFGGNCCGGKLFGYCVAASCREESM